MRKRWRTKYGFSVDAQQDSPSNLPVNFAHEDAGSGSEIDLECSAGGADLGLPSEDSKVVASSSHPFPPVAPPGIFMAADADDRVKFVDKGGMPVSDGLPALEKVSAAAPPSIVSEALRLTDKKGILYPWEKGRLGRLFGNQGRLNLIEDAKASSGG